jgi:hypothetical protein
MNYSQLKPGQTVKLSDGTIVTLIINTGTDERFWLTTGSNDDTAFINQEMVKAIINAKPNLDTKTFERMILDYCGGSVDFNEGAAAFMQELGIDVEAEYPAICQWQSVEDAREYLANGIAFSLASGTTSSETIKSAMAFVQSIENDALKYV